MPQLMVARLLLLCHLSRFDPIIPAQMALNECCTYPPHVRLEVTSLKRKKTQLFAKRHDSTHSATLRAPARWTNERRTEEHLAVLLQSNPLFPSSVTAGIDGTRFADSTPSWQEGRKLVSATSDQFRDDLSRLQYRRFRPSGTIVDSSHLSLISPDAKSDEKTSTSTLHYMTLETPFQAGTEWTMDSSKVEDSSASIVL